MKKVLIITYYWPPAGGPGVQRVLKFVKYLPQFGWEPIVLTVEKGEYPAIDESLLMEIPKNLKVYKTKSFEPFNLYKKLTGQKGNIPTHVLSKSDKDSFIQKFSKWIRANLFVPDARIGWISTIVREGLKIVEIEKPDLIFSSSPPHSLQIGAMKLAKKSGLKWVADLRDPWTDGFWQKELPKIKYALNKDHKLESEVLNNADSIITVSDSIVKLFSEKSKNKYHSIPNGYDESDFAGVQKQKSNNFKIVYSGSLRKSQIPYKFFSTLKSFKEQKQIDHLEVHFIGTIHPDARKVIDDSQLNDIVKINNYMPHAELINHIVNAEMLLLSIPNTQNNKGILTGKLFEYVGSNNFILGFGPKDGDAAKIINELNYGEMLDFNDDPSELILAQYKSWTEGIKTIPNNTDMYTRKNLTEKLSQIFESVL